MWPQIILTAWETAGWILLPIGVGGIISLVAWMFSSTRIKEEAAEKVTSDRTEAERQALIIRVKTLETTLADFSEKIALMNQTVTPMYEAMKQKMVEILTHPDVHFAVPDAILAKIKDPEQNPTAAEMIELEKLLKERQTSLDPEVTREEQLAAKALPEIIKLAKLEKESLDEGERVIEMISTKSKTTIEEAREK